MTQGDTGLTGQEFRIVIGDGDIIHLGNIAGADSVHDGFRVLGSDLHQTANQLLALIDIDDRLQEAHTDTAGAAQFHVTGLGDLSGNGVVNLACACGDTTGALQYYNTHYSTPSFRRISSRMATTFSGVRLP